MAQSEDRPEGASPGEPEYELYKAVAQLEKNHYTKSEIINALIDVTNDLMGTEHKPRQ